MSITIGPALKALGEEVLADGRVSAEDVAKLRVALYADGDITADEAAFLFELNHASRDNDPAWDALFLEAMTNHFLWDRGGSPLIGEMEAEELIAAISHDGRVDDRTELRLLLRLVFRVHNCPERLRRFAFEAATDSILKSDQPIFGKGVRRAGVIDEDDLEIVRRLLFNPAADGGLTIGQAEADWLFDLNDATAGRDNAPGWQELFVKAITGFLLLGGPGDERVDQIEARWLLDRIRRDRHVTENERALLAYLKAEARDIDPMLMPIIEQHA